MVGLGTKHSTPCSILTRSSGPHPAHWLVPSALGCHSLMHVGSKKVSCAQVALAAQKLPGTPVLEGGSGGSWKLEFREGGGHTGCGDIFLLQSGLLSSAPSTRDPPHPSPTPPPSRSSQPSSFLPLPCQPHTEGSPPASSQGLSRNKISHVLRGNMFIHLSLVCPWVPLWEFWKAAPDGPAPPPPSY